MNGGLIEAGLSAGALDLHRALASLQEELEAIDNYHQRADVSEDASIKAILIHNRNDEMEHAAMLLEWLRRAMPEFDTQMRKFIFASGALTEVAAGAGPPAAPGSGLGLGNLK
ncbi:ferritin [Geothrix rubra]|uniref:Ferritin n=1 Tax=Geothrix rubra TaxID=2927977 RepID=A0ABQ5QA07_9BACT|nr:hypothetical protein [Geothrix rubra]GLH71186.1 ferritin [Geothrix rubra]